MIQGLVISGFVLSGNVFVILLFMTQNSNWERICDSFFRVIFASILICMGGCGIYLHRRLKVEAVTGGRSVKVHITSPCEDTDCQYQIARIMCSFAIVGLPVILFAEFTRVIPTLSHNDPIQISLRVLQEFCVISCYVSFYKMLALNVTKLSPNLYILFRV